MNITNEKLVKLCHGILPYALAKDRADFIMTMARELLSFREKGVKMGITLYIVLIIPPDNDINLIETVLCVDYIEAENTIEEYKRWDTYEGYKYVIKEDDVELDITIG